MLVRGGDGHLDHSNHRRIGPGVQAGDVFVAAIDRQAILNQIVRADAEEIDHLDKAVHHNHCRGHLDHHANFQIAIERDAGFLEILHRVGQHHFGLPKLQHRGDQRKHDADVAQGAGPQDRAQLNPEQVAIAQ